MISLYTATATATAGRDGKVSSSDDKIKFALSTPKELGGPGGEGTNPEQLFAAGYAACFGSAIKLVASQKKVTVGEVEVTAKIGIGKKEPAFGLTAELSVKIGKVSAAQVQELMTAAHNVCPYSLAIKHNVDVKLTAL